MEISLNGYAFKYTNFLFGYQQRYFKLLNGIIYYYLSKEAEKDGCRKFKTLTNFSLQYDEDPCRLDIVFPDEKWSLRFHIRNELVLWKNALQALLIEKKYVKKQLRLISSPTNSTTSTSTHFAFECKTDTSDLSLMQNECKSKTIVININTLRQLRSEIPSQLNSMMCVLDTITALMTENELRLSSGVKNNIMSELNMALNNCYLLKKDIAYLQNVFIAISTKLENESKMKTSVCNFVDNDDENDEWADAIDGNDNSFSNLDETRMTQDFSRNPLQTTAVQLEKDVFCLPNKQMCDTKIDSAKDLLNNSKVTSDSCVKKQFDSLFAPNLITENPLFAEIQTISWEQLKYALAPLENGGWDLFVKDGEMSMYRMDHEDEGIACDPLKAIHSVKGVSAQEFIDTFFDPNLKTEWDDTLVRLKVVDQLAENTFVLHQLHKRIWPSAQREALFWSQRLDVSAHRDPDAINAFLVCNHDTERENVPLTDSSCLRVKLTIAMLCQTVLINPAIKENLNRDDICCKITYVAQVHPGGWVPTPALRQIYKREYPKFLRRFTNYVVKRVKSRPLYL